MTSRPAPRIYNRRTGVCYDTEQAAIADIEALWMILVEGNGTLADRTQAYGIAQNVVEARHPGIDGQAKIRATRALDAEIEARMRDHHGRTA